MTATRSPSVMASVWSWVTYTVVVPSRFWIRATSVRICTRSFASRFDSGSSIRNAFGARTTARPIATRRRSAPERGARPPHRHPLALAAGQVRRLAVQVRLQFEDVGHRLDLGRDLGLGYLRQLQ